MRIRNLLLFAALPFAFAACDNGALPAEGEQVPQQVTSTPTAAPGEQPLPEAFTSRDCATVAAAYSDALTARDFVLAARAWAEPIGSAELATRYEGYGAPSLDVGQAERSGTAGTLYCELTITLRDDDDAQRPLRQGTMTLRRVNDVPGASVDQLRWRIIDSTIEERMPRNGEGEPA